MCRLLAVVTAAVVLLVATVGLQPATLVGDVAQIPRSLPLPVLPDLALIQVLLLPAIAIAAIGLIQGAGVGQNYPNPGGDFPDASRDFVGQGAANIAGGLFGAIPSGGSMSGTAVTVQAGAQSRWANIFGGLTVERYGRPRASSADVVRQGIVTAHHFSEHLPWSQYSSPSFFFSPA